MKILVTGATGFIGRRVVRTLCDAKVGEVIGISRKAESRGRDEARIVPLDLFDAMATQELLQRERPTHLIHLAWEALPGIFWTSPSNADWVAHSLLLVRAFREAGGQRAVFAGTCAEYDWTGNAVLSDVATPRIPQTFYGIAKDALWRTISGLSAQIDLSVAWGRIFWLFGPGEAPNRLVSDAIAGLRSGRSVSLSSGLQRRDYLHVDDVAGAFVAAALSEYVGAFNVGSGVDIAVRVLVERLGELCGRPDLLMFGERPSPPNEPPLLVADVRTLRDVIGFRPRFSIETGLRDLLR